MFTSNTNRIPERNNQTKAIDLDGIEEIKKSEFVDHVTDTFNVNSLSKSLSFAQEAFTISSCDNKLNHEFINKIMTDLIHIKDVLLLLQCFKEKDMVHQLKVIKSN